MYIAVRRIGVVQAGVSTQGRGDDRRGYPEGCHYTRV